MLDFLKCVLIPRRITTREIQTPHLSCFTPGAPLVTENDICSQDRVKGNINKRVRLYLESLEVVGQR